MKTTAWICGAVGLGTLAAGCFATNPSVRVGDAVAATRIDGALSATDVAVDPETGDLILSDWSGTLTIVGRTTGAVRDTLNSGGAGSYATSVGALSGGRVFVSDGMFNNAIVDLTTGATTPVTGMDALGDGSPAFADGGGGDLGGGDGDVVVTMECEPPPGSTMMFWSGTGSERTLLREVPMPNGVEHVQGVAYAPDRGLVLALTDDGLQAFDDQDGHVVLTIEDVGAYETTGLAYDAALGRVLTMRVSGWGGSATTVEEYQL
jgi:hypothetical protein